MQHHNNIVIHDEDNDCNVADDDDEVIDNLNAKQADQNQKWKDN